MALVIPAKLEVHCGGYVTQDGVERVWITQAPKTELGETQEIDIAVDDVEALVDALRCAVEEAKSSAEL